MNPGNPLVLSSPGLGLKNRQPHVAFYLGIEFEFKSSRLHTKSTNGSISPAGKDFFSDATDTVILGPCSSVQNWEGTAPLATGLSV